LLELAAGESVTLDDTNLTDVSPNEVCQAAMTNAEQHNTNGLELSFTTELSNDFTIKSNDETIKHILDKIIDNALKFTSDGSINLHASLQDGMVRLCVTDTGIGIPEAHQLDVFDNFVKLDDYKGGVGLGLPICKRLAHSLGGDVILDKSYTEGSRFIVLLPVR
jgi:signal transduction histidine kinase